MQAVLNWGTCQNGNTLVYVDTIIENSVVSILITKLTGIYTYKIVIYGRGIVRERIKTFVSCFLNADSIIIQVIVHTHFTDIRVVIKNFRASILLQTLNKVVLRVNHIIWVTGSTNFILVKLIAVWICENVSVS